MKVVTCKKEDVAEHIADADVAIPFGAQLTRAVIQSSTRLKLIIQASTIGLFKHVYRKILVNTKYENVLRNLSCALQFGVGLEGVDIVAATEHGTWVRPPPFC